MTIIVDDLNDLNVDDLMTINCSWMTIILHTIWYLVG